jgi:OOP family OmpA-OmpF porin
MLTLPLIAAALAGQAAPGVPARRDCPDIPPGATVFQDPFLVFFDWDSSAITPDAATTLDNVTRAFALLSEQCAMVISAYADRSGPVGYNLALTQRRAMAVLGYLRGRGVAGEARVEWFGETRPIVETADGARAVLNRRAQIMVLPRSGR